MSAQGPARTPPRRGITMLELIAVITLLGILAALAVPTMAVTGRAA
ncbi:MAG: type II secretion system protein, partial [Candidatus Sumerlaeia bacterium]|nr:type II secretion system protein [Candidatus Sumerlaeia bacterium]